MACYDRERPPSTILSITDVAGYWRRVGGSDAAVVSMVAVAGAESGFDLAALSSACAIGFWQIIPAHALDNGLDPNILWNPTTNATYARSLSQNGAELAPWDSAYAAGEALTTRYHLSLPEVGSNAYAFLPRVAAELGLADPSGQAPAQRFGPVTPAQGGPIPAVGFPPGGSSSQGQQGQVIPATRPRFDPWGPIEPPLPRAAGWDNLRQWWGQDQQSVLLQYNAIYDWLRDNLR